VNSYLIMENISSSVWRNLYRHFRKSTSHTISVDLVITPYSRMISLCLIKRTKNHQQRKHYRRRKNNWNELSIRWINIKKRCRNIRHLVSRRYQCTLCLLLHHLRYLLSSSSISNHRKLHQVLLEIHGIRRFRQLLRCLSKL